MSIRAKGVDLKTGKIILSETQIKAQIKGFLALFGVWNWHNLAGLGCYAGLLDRSGFYKTKAFFIEVKSARGKLSFEQRQFKAKAEAQGAKVFVPRGFDEFETEWNEWIRKIEE